MTASPRAGPTDDGCRLFWSWIGEMRFDLEKVSPERPGFVEDVAQRMKELHPSLGCEVAFHEGGARTLRLTCQADASAAAFVERLHATAPPMTGWRVTKFRPRVPGIGHITVEGTTLGADDVEFTILRKGETPAGPAGLAIVLYVRGLEPEKLGHGSINPPEAQCALFLLEHLLGEEDLMRGVAAIRVIPFAAQTEWPRRSLREVAGAFDGARGGETPPRTPPAEGSAARAAP